MNVCFDSHSPSSPLCIRRMGRAEAVSYCSYRISLALAPEHSTAFTHKLCIAFLVRKHSFLPALVDKIAAVPHFKEGSRCQILMKIHFT